jgi:hypothetical protein
MVLAILGFLPWYKFDWQQINGTDVHLIAVVPDGYWMFAAGLVVAGASATMVKADRILPLMRYCLLVGSLGAFAIAVRNLVYRGDVCHPQFDTSGYVSGPSCLGWNGGDVFWGPVPGEVTATVWIAASLAAGCALIAFGLPSIENRLYENEEPEIGTKWA